MNKPFDFRDRLDSPAVHVRIGDDEPTILDDLRDLWAEIRASPSSHAAVGVVGLITGCFGVIVPALLWSWLL